MINDNAQQNTNGSNSSQIIWKHCEFDNVASYAIETDYATLYWTMETCYAYSNFGYGAATIKDPNFTSLICSIMIKNRIATDSSIEFNAITNSGFGNGKNRLYLDSSNILSFNDNNNNKRNFHYIRFGVTSNRPVDALTGTMYLDTTLSKPVWWTGSKWVFADGTNA